MWKSLVYFSAAPLLASAPSLRLLWRRHWPCSRTCILTTGYFYDKTKIVKANRREDYYLLLKYFSRQCALLSTTWANHLKNLTSKCKTLSMFWIEIVNKRTIEQFNFLQLAFKC